MTSSKSRRRPDLFIIGAAKCGTTSLYNYLSGHPDIYMSPDKEPGYFAPDLASDATREALRYGRDLERYLGLFADAGQARRLGEASVRYLRSEQAPQLIHDFQAEPFVVVMIRNPVDMVYSLHGQRFAEGGEDLADFAEALSAEADRRKGRRIPRGAKNPRLTTYLDRARFGQQLPRWFDTFGRERLHVIVLEDFVRDQRAEFRRLLEFLDVDPDYLPVDFQRHNPSHAPRSATVRAILNAQAPRGPIRRLIPQDVRDGLRRQIIRRIRMLNRKPVKRPPLSPELRRRLEVEFMDDVLLTSELLGRDLAGQWFGARPAAPAQQVEAAST